MLGQNRRVVLPFLLHRYHYGDSHESTDCTFSIQIGEETFSFMKLKEIEETHRKHMESFLLLFNSLY